MAGLVTSITCTSRSAPITSSSVARNAATRSCGNRSIKPTVSATSNRRASGSFIGRTSGSSVANTAADGCGPPRVNRLNTVVLPAFVYPTSATVGTETLCRRSRACVRRPRTMSSARPSVPIRRRIRRRSVSSFVSPGPRVPIPPPSRDKAMPAPTNRGSRYLSCASSTCNFPSRVLAREAKMSRMSCVRSSTRRSSVRSRLRSCPGLNSLLKITRSAPASSHASASIATLPRPSNSAGSGRRRSCNTCNTTVTPAAAARPRSSSRECSTSTGRSMPNARPTTAAHSRAGDSRDGPPSITRGIVARGSTGLRRRGGGRGARRACPQSSTPCPSIALSVRG